MYLRQFILHVGGFGVRVGWGLPASRPQVLALDTDSDGPNALAAPAAVGYS